MLVVAGVPDIPIMDYPMYRVVQVAVLFFYGRIRLSETIRPSLHRVPMVVLPFQTEQVEVELVVQSSCMPVIIPDR